MAMGDDSMETPPLQPLRIPAGWLVTYNDFREADPSPRAIDAGWLREDLLQIKRPEAGILVDVGWCGDAGSGGFALFAFEGDFHGTQLHEFRSRDRLAVVAELERLLDAPGRTA